MFLRIRVLLTLLVCLAAAPSFAAAGPHNRNGLNASALPSVWFQPNRLGSAGLFCAACLCLTVLQVKVRRRKDGADLRQAKALAGALRSGALDFAECPHAESSIWKVWAEADDEEPEARALVPSRYHTLGYGQEESYVVKVIVTPGPDEETVAPITDEDLLRGIPREFLGDEIDAPWRYQFTE